MKSSEKMPAAEAQQLIDELGSDMREIVDELPGQIMQIVRDKCGDEVSEAELERVETVLERLLSEAQGQ